MFTIVAVLLTYCPALHVVVAPAPTDRPLPPTDVWPRAKAEWDAKRARPERQGPFYEGSPERAQLYHAAQDRMRTMTEKYTASGVVYTAALADELIAELWVDNGHPSLNNTVQDLIIDLVDEVVRWPEERFPPDARHRITEGLLAYVHAGGGRCAPGIQSHLATALARVAPDNPEALEIVDHLLDDAMTWAVDVDSEIQQKTVERVCRWHWGEAAGLRLYEIQSRDQLPADAPPESYRKALDALAALLAADPSGRPADLYERLRRAERAVSIDPKDDRLRDDLVCRTLIVYRVLLDRRPMIADRASSHIESQFMILHKDKLRTDRHWDLWTQAVSALGPERLSNRFKRHLVARAERKDLPAAERTALDRLHLLLKD